ncbi:hypothetical protein BCR34DRAFT_79308 [Clohesyomyces aquaticus]|uniref:Alcohol acetyltransferase n=1 Tax=Clohesyomyces aquaticus TaxID=1231657 RepID=A0A1Y1YXK7_9PLEO|nr:hypothetical protein BCR34DRAFT_79308 [Clohesyomyces aquaticus]
MSNENVQLRAASPYERRLAIREELGFYNAAALGAIYEFADSAFDVSSAHSFVQPLKRCIDKYAYMGVVLKGKHTESPVWEGVPNIKLNDHITIHHQAAGGADERTLIENALPGIVDAKFTGPSPPWRLVVLPLSPKEDKPRCFIAFAISHSIGDGGAGLAFHHTFLEALRRSKGTDDDFNVVVPDRQLPEPFDTPERLPVSPDFLRSVMTSSVVGDGTWTGSKVFLDEQEGLHTKIRVLEIDSRLVDAALRVARSRDTKLTPTIHQVIVRALSKVVTDGDVTNFASQTAIDLRGANGVGLEWGIYVSGHAASHARVDTSGPVSDEMWQSASSLSRKLGQLTGKLDNQMIGLLRFIPSQKDSMASKLGTTREGSYALSNMLAIDGGAADESCRITKMVVATSAAVPSAPLSFCIISVKGGSMVCTVSWQPGALGCPVDKEYSFVDEICSSMEADFAIFPQLLES